MAKITIIGPEGRTQQELGEHNTLGRHPANTHQIIDRIVSKEHCHIDYEGGRWLVKDLGSLNGTFVNGEKVKTHALRHGDEISIGSTRIVFREREDTGEHRIRGLHGTGPIDVKKSVKKPASGAAQASPLQASPLRGAGHLTDALHSVGGGLDLGANLRQVTPSTKDISLPVQNTLQQKQPGKKKRRMTVTIDSSSVQSEIRTKLAPVQQVNFVGAELIKDDAQLRADYEKLRASYEVSRAVANTVDIDAMLEKILDTSFKLLTADRGVVLLYSDERVLEPRCVRSKDASDAVENVAISQTIVEAVERDRAGVLSSDASQDSRFSAAKSIIMQGIRSSMAVPIMQNEELFGIMLVDSHIAAGAFTKKDLQLLQTIADQAAVAIQNHRFAQKLEQEAVTRQRFQRLLSPAIAEQVLSGAVEIKKGGESRETTVLFSDLRGFTAMSENMRPEDVVDMLNEYFELMVEVIFESEGTLDKFVGDEIMALFGAPVAHKDDPLRAVLAAKKMQHIIKNVLNPARAGRDLPPLHAGIGINTGPMVAGYLGSSRALEYTVIGDAVNTGARLCAVAKHGEVIISESTYQAVKAHVQVETLPPQKVKGKAEALNIYRVVD